MLRFYNRAQAKVGPRRRWRDAVASSEHGGATGGGGHLKIAVAGGTGVVGRHVIEGARELGHEVVSISRASGVDLTTGTGLASAVRGSNVIIDVSNSGSSNRKSATAFFINSTRNLHLAAKAAGISHLVVLSIVGIDKAPGLGYYDAKRAQEREALNGPVPTSVVRSTQFHEFAGQLVARLSIGPVVGLPSFPVQPVAARSVAVRLVEIAGGDPESTSWEIGGPEEIELVSAARQTLAKRGVHRAVIPVRVPGALGRALRGGALLGTSATKVVGPRFSEWLEGPDFV